ncbi:hypothetical protein [Segatella paludivivens]|uniref:hypothetical protein n=1 Tax=Segatella paludivivens TaxID=185294 RepID=UPI000472083A|nr:hypothetical protein [Segatella paludivivens]
MNIKQIISRRSYLEKCHALDIIYEWENVISKEMSLSITSISKIQRAYKRLHIFPTLLTTYKNSLYYVINARDEELSINKKNIIPCIIDFFLKDEQLQHFYSIHSNNKLILLSSPFDYEYLIEKKCPIPIALMAYSLSDEYTLDNRTFNKKYDIVLTGRQDPLLYSFFKEYIKKHPEVTYVERGKGDGNVKNLQYYINGTTLLGDIKTRKGYMDLLSQGRVSLYGTQGYVMDGITTGFYHVTPRFLEQVACGCHILAHYPECPDSKYYQLCDFSPSIESYESFEYYMDRAIKTPVDISKYNEYLKKHYTSTRYMN